MKTRDFDALIAHLGELGVLDREDLVIMHSLPPQERLPYVQGRAQAAVDRTEQEHGPAHGDERQPDAKRVGGHTWL